MCLEINIMLLITLVYYFHTKKITPKNMFKIIIMLKSIFMYNIIMEDLKIGTKGYFHVFTLQ